MYAELRDSFAACAAQIGVSYATLDCRLLCRYPQKTSYSSKGTSDNHTSNDLTLLTTNIEDVVRKAPCILHIESFDLVFHDPAQQHSSNPDDSQEELFLRAFKAFINDLYSKVESNYHFDASKGKATDINQDTIVVVVSTNGSSAVKPQLKALFSAEIKLPQTSLTATQFTTLLKQCNISNTTATTETLTSNTQCLTINADAEKLLYNHAHTHALSYTTTIMLMEEVKKRSIARVHGPIWLHTLGLAPAKPLQRQLPLTAKSAITGPIHIATADVKKTLSEVPCLNAFDTTSGLENKKNGQKQASIAPVHWADIGGLDRYNN